MSRARRIASSVGPGTSACRMPIARGRAPLPVDSAWMISRLAAWERANATHAAGDGRRQWRRFILSIQGAPGLTPQ
jgi:hypothetical protein